MTRRDARRASRSQRRRCRRRLPRPPAPQLPRRPDATHPPPGAASRFPAVCSERFLVSLAPAVQGGEPGLPRQPPGLGRPAASPKRSASSLRRPGPCSGASSSRHSRTPEAGAAPPHVSPSRPAFGALSHGQQVICGDARITVLSIGLLVKGPFRSRTRSSDPDDPRGRTEAASQPPSRSNARARRKHLR